MIVLPSSYDFIMDHEINAPGHGNNVLGGINAMNKCDLKRKMYPIVKLARNNTLNIGMLPSASKEVSVKFTDQCLHILNNE